jgi:hypothetical protein
VGYLNHVVRIGVCRKHGATVTLPNNVVQMRIKPRMEGCFLNMVPFGRRNGAVMRGMNKFSQSGGRCLCKKHGASKTKLSSSAAAVLMIMDRQQLLPLPITAKTSFPM